MTRMTRMKRVVACAALVAALLGTTAGARATSVTGADWVCTAAAVWTVSPGPVTGSASGTITESCTGASATADSGGGNAVRTLPSSSILSITLSTVSLLYMTGPVRAYTGVITGSSLAGWTAAGWIGAVDGGALALDVTLTSGTVVDVLHFSGAASCGTYCFSATGAWTGAALTIS